jgi:hypothetical protein
MVHKVEGAKGDQRKVIEDMNELNEQTAGDAVTELAQSAAQDYVAAEEQLLDAVDDFTGKGDAVQVDRVDALFAYLRSTDGGAELAEALRFYIVRADLSRRTFDHLRDVAERVEAMHEATATP